MNEIDVLHSPFDIEMHKRTFVNYLEVVILEDGTIEYAVPSHQEKLIKLCMERLKVTRQELCDLCPQIYFGDFTRWLCEKSQSISVWNDFYIGCANAAQREALRTLKYHRLYRGEVAE